MLAHNVLCMTRKAPSEQFTNDCIGCHGRRFLVSERKITRSCRSDHRLARAFRKACATCHQSRDAKESVQATKDHVHPSGNKRGGRLIATNSLQKDRIADMFQRMGTSFATLVMAVASRTAAAGVTMRCGQSYVTLDFYIQFRHLSRSDTSSNNFFLQRNRIMFHEDTNITLDPTRLVVGKFRTLFTRESPAACRGPLTVDRAERLTCTPSGACHDSATKNRGKFHNAIPRCRLVVHNGRPDNGAPQYGTPAGAGRRRVKPEGPADSVAAEFRQDRPRPATAHASVPAAGIENCWLPTAPIWSPAATGGNGSHSWTRF